MGFFCFQVLFLAAAVASERSDTRFLLTDNAGGGYASFSCRLEPSQFFLCVCVWVCVCDGFIWNLLGARSTDQSFFEKVGRNVCFLFFMG